MKESCSCRRRLLKSNGPVCLFLALCVCVENFRLCRCSFIVCVLSSAFQSPVFLVRPNTSVVAVKFVIKSDNAFYVL